jgi:hypothetical protein
MTVHRDDELFHLVPGYSVEKSLLPVFFLRVLLPVIGSGAKLITITPGWLSTQRRANNWGNKLLVLSPAQPDLEL